MPDFLLEIGCEEIPARMIDAGSRGIARARGGAVGARAACAGRATFTISIRRGGWRFLPREFPRAQPDLTEQVTGPSVTVAYKDGQPTPAAHAFAKKAGVDVSQLEKVTTPKGEYLSAKITKKGRAASEILAELLPKEISSIYWPKNMYWRKPNGALCASGALDGRDAGRGSRFRWSSTAFGREMILAGTGFLRTERFRSRRRARLT